MKIKCNGGIGRIDVQPIIGTLTETEVRILNHYLTIARDGKFSASRRTIANAVGLKVWDGGRGQGNEDAGDNRTVRRANEHFKHLGILSWVRGFGGGGKALANQYILNLMKIKELSLCPPVGVVKQ